jgi:hypothetical protein
MDPASIRTNNPGAQWMGPVAQSFGATGSIPLPGGNNAATFDDPVSGAAAQFALLSKRYTGMPLSGAIAKWSGGNSSPAYAQFLQKQTGISPDTVLTPSLLQGPAGLALVKAQAQWEAGRPFPLSDDQWRTAQSRAFGGAPAAGQQPAQQGPAPTQLLSPQSMASAAPPNLPLFSGQPPAPSSGMAPPQAGGSASPLASFFAGLPAGGQQAPPPMPIAMPPQHQVDLSGLMAFLRSQQPTGS